MNTKTSLQTYGPVQVQDLSKPSSEAEATSNHFQTGSGWSDKLLSLVTRKFRQIVPGLLRNRSLSLTHSCESHTYSQILPANRWLWDTSTTSSSRPSSRDQISIPSRSIDESRDCTRIGASSYHGEGVRGSIPSFISRGMTPAPIYRNVGVQWLDTATVKKNCGNLD